MNKIIASSLISFLLSTSVFSKFEKHDSSIYSYNLYQRMQLANLGLSQDIFNKALAGQNLLKSNHQISNNHIISIIDFSQSSNNKRLYVIDLNTHKILFNTYVAHGRNSGDEFAHTFSNTSNSLKSSLGFYVTESTYNGSHGLSLRLKGVERNINDEAVKRAIVLHGADYVSESFINKNARLGRSHGCPAVPVDMCTPIVNAIKEGSCFFIFYPDKDYLSMSEFLL